MKYIYTTDEFVKNYLLSQSYRLITQREAMSCGTVWVFENQETKSVCFFIDGIDCRQKCFVSDNLTLTF